ncbi:hypothetical protein HN587_02995 [Candidatus Woesearchaeota archaeon]|jgi:hypothetical protein|nr:hypothetical protein [Candidatus Woesearchaeota archaeon]
MKGEDSKQLDVVLMDSVCLLVGRFDTLVKYSVMGKIKDKLNEALAAQKTSVDGYRGMVLMCNGSQERFNFGIVQSRPEFRFRKTYGTSDVLFNLEFRIPDYFENPLDDKSEKKESYVHLLPIAHRALFETAARAKGYGARFFDGAQIDDVILGYIRNSTPAFQRGMRVIIPPTDSRSICDYCRSSCD